MADWRSARVLVVVDAGYAVTRLTFLLADLPVELLGRMRSGRVERRLSGWDQDLGRPRVLPLWRAVILLCFLLRHNAVQEMAGELFGCAPTHRLALRCAAAAGVARQPQTAGLRHRPSAVERAGPVVDRLLIPCWDWKAAEQLFSAKHRRRGHNVQVISDLRGTGSRAVRCPAPAMTPTPPREPGPPPADTPASATRATRAAAC